MLDNIKDLLELSLKQVKCKMMCSSKFKVFMVLLGLILYVYVLIFIKHLYTNSKRLDHILDLTLETEKKILKIQYTDQDLAAKISDIEKIYEEY